MHHREHHDKKDRPLPEFISVISASSCAKIRIDDIEVHCRETDELEGAIIVEVSYRVRSTNNRYNRVYPFYRTEGSEGGDVI